MLGATSEDVDDIFEPTTQAEIVADSKLERSINDKPPHSNGIISIFQKLCMETKYSNYS